MRLALVVLVAIAGVLATIYAAMRMWKASRRGQRELMLGYLALMVVVSVASLLLLRAL